MTNAIANRIQELGQQLPDTVQLVAVSKTVPVEKMRWAYEAGVRHFGESKVQEALEKQAALQDLPGIVWHFIGHLQSNKARKVFTAFDWVHSVDSVKLAQRFQQLTQELGPGPKLLLQVKMRPDPSKFGWCREDLEAHWDFLTGAEFQLRGLMTILPRGLTPGERLQVFQEMAQLRSQLQRAGLPQLTELSMGMSGDFPEAIAAGSTLVRIGQGIFGDRNYP